MKQPIINSNDGTSMCMDYLKQSIENLKRASELISENNTNEKQFNSKNCTELADAVQCLSQITKTICSKVFHEENDPLEQAMQSKDFWMTFDTSYGQITLHGRNSECCYDEYFEVSAKMTEKHEDFSILFFLLIMTDLSNISIITMETDFTIPLLANTDRGHK